MLYKVHLQLHIHVQLPCYDFVPVSSSQTQNINNLLLKKITITPLVKTPLPDRDGRFVLSLRTNSPLFS